LLKPILGELLLRVIGAAPHKETIAKLQTLSCARLSVDGNA
jgi:hypothetical protein